MRYGANAKAMPAATETSRRPVISCASAAAAMAHSGNVNTNAALYAATGLPVSHWIGAVIGRSPTSSSDSAIEPAIGKNIGPFHHGAVSGTARVLHHRIQVLSTGSPASCGRVDPN